MKMQNETEKVRNDRKMWVILHKTTSVKLGKNTKFHSWNLCKGLTYFRKGCIIFDMKEGILVCVL